VRTDRVFPGPAEGLSGWVYLALLSEITEAVLGEREVADHSSDCSCWRKSDPDERAKPGDTRLLQFVDRAARRLAWIT